jgi:hypothetical protein
MNGRRFLGAMIIGSALFARMLGAPLVADADGTEPDCIGRHVSTMAREHGGLAAATEHHNAEHGDDLSVGEHLAHVRTECRG